MYNCYNKSDSEGIEFKNYQKSKFLKNPSNMDVWVIFFIKDFLKFIYLVTIIFLPPQSYY